MSTAQAECDAALARHRAASDELDAAYAVHEAAEQRLLRAQNLVLATAGDVGRARAAMESASLLGRDGGQGI